MTEFNDGYLQAKSVKMDNINELYNETYDLIILSSSWDRRSVSITSAENISGTHGLLLKYIQDDGQGIQRGHDSTLSDFLQSKVRSDHEIFAESTEVDDYWSKIRSVIQEVALEVGKPLKVFLDLSACPRIFALGMVSFLFKQGLAERLVVNYGEAKYAHDETGTTAPIFTGAKWRNILAPGFEGKHNPGAKDHYIVSVGWEGEKTLRMVTKKDPDFLSVVFPEPGFQKDYTNKTYQINKKLLEMYCVPDSNIIKAHAGDSVEVWKMLSERNIEDSGGCNVSFVCCGTKSHTLGLSLRALTLEHSAIIYNVPDEHKFVDTFSNGYFWRYEIRDLSAV